MSSGYLGPQVADLPAGTKRALEAKRLCAADGHYDWERVGTMHTRDEVHHIYWCPRCGAVENHVREAS